MKNFCRSHPVITKAIIWILIVALGVALMILIFAEDSSNDKKALAKVTNALDNLKSLDKMYTISNIVQAPDGDMCYIEICDGDTNYTEYPIDKDGNYGTIALQNANEGTSYVLTDWISKDKGYMLSSEETWLSYPDKYTKLLDSRRYMYFDVILKNIKDLKFKETITANIGMGDESIDIYTATIGKNTVRDILGLSAEKMYQVISETSKDKNIKKLCNFYLDDIGFTMVFSDANLTIGVVDGVLRYIQMEVGGLGSRMYVSKSVVIGDVEKRQEPDFSKVVTYESTLKDLADYVSKYDTYEDAMVALGSEENNLQENSSGNTEQSSTSQEETSSEQETTSSSN